jgi:hypothetical protein
MMSFLPHRPGRDGGAAARLNRDEAAYVLIEEARLRCARLRDRERAEGSAVALDRVHRELGLAGYFASSALPRRRRLPALDRARARCVSNELSLSPAIRLLETLVSRARRAVESALGVPELSDHMHLAHVHILDAQKLLGDVRRSAAAVLWTSQP